MPSVSVTIEVAALPEEVFGVLECQYEGAAYRAAWMAGTAASRVTITYRWGIVTSIMGLGTMRLQACKEIVSTARLPEVLVRERDRRSGAAAGRRSPVRLGVRLASDLVREVARAESRASGGRVRRRTWGRISMVVNASLMMRFSDPRAIGPEVRLAVAELRAGDRSIAEVALHRSIDREAVTGAFARIKPSRQPATPRASA